MRLEKKLITKEDGRHLTYYHFPDSATAEQTAAFAHVDTERSTQQEGPDAQDTKETERV